MRKYNIFLLLMLMGFFSLIFLVGCGEPTEREVNKILVGLSYDLFKEEHEKKQELTDLIVGVDGSLISGYDSKADEWILNMSKLSEVAEQGKILLDKKGKERVNDVLSENYDELLVLLENKRWHEDRKIKSIFDKLQLSNFIGFTNFAHLEVLRAYYRLEIYCIEGKSDVLIVSCLRRIPDNYIGPLNDQILLRKKTIASTSESYKARMAVQELLKEREEFEAIEITEWNWYIERNYAHLEGKVKNNHAVSISYVKVEVVYMDENSNILDTDWTYAVGTHPLRPGHVRSFSLMTRHSEGMARASIEVVSFSKN